MLAISQGARPCESAYQVREYLAESSAPIGPVRVLEPQCRSLGRMRRVLLPIHEQVPFLNPPGTHVKWRNPAHTHFCFGFPHTLYFHEFCFTTAAICSHTTRKWLQLPFQHTRSGYMGGVAYIYIWISSTGFYGTLPHERATPATKGAETIAVRLIWGPS